MNKTIMLIDSKSKEFLITGIFLGKRYSYSNHLFYSQMKIVNALHCPILFFFSLYNLPVLFWTLKISIKYFVVHEHYRLLVCNSTKELRSQFVEISAVPTCQSRPLYSQVEATNSAKSYYFVDSKITLFSKNRRSHENPQFK